MTGAANEAEGCVKSVRLLTGITLAVAGFLGATSAINADGTDLRAEREGDVAAYVRSQVQRNEQLSQEVSQLRDQVDSLAAKHSRGGASAAERKVVALAPEAGLTPLQGPGVTVTLDDAPEAQREADVDPNALIVHQQDIQAVVNALWAGGAEAMSIQGRRVISTSAIRCVGNSVVLHGVPYPPPYTIVAIGDISGMIEALAEAPGVRTYLDYVARFHLGYALRQDQKLTVPGFTGSLELPHARRAGH